MPECEQTHTARSQPVATCTLPRGHVGMHVDQDQNSQWRYSDQEAGER